jgi:hypothetical protein
MTLVCCDGFVLLGWLFVVIVVMYHIVGSDFRHYLLVVIGIIDNPHSGALEMAV